MPPKLKRALYIGKYCKLSPKISIWIGIIVNTQLYADEYALYADEYALNADEYATVREKSAYSVRNYTQVYAVLA